MIDIDDLTVVFDGRLWRAGRQALNHVSVEIGEGDAFALIGPNGAGKSTLIYCLLGLLSPTSGSARVLGRVLEPGSALFRDIVFVPEEPHYHDYLTVEEAVRYYAALHGETLSAARLTEFMELTRTRGAALRSCTIKKQTLEESFLATLGESERGHV